VPFAIFMPYDFENFLYGPFSCLIVSFNPKVYFYHVDVLEHYREERKSLKIIEARESLIVHIHEQKIMFFFYVNEFHTKKAPLWCFLSFILLEKGKSGLIKRNVFSIRFYFSEHD
jgi:hypothetical protein